MTDIDLSRDTSRLLTEVRTVLGRAETALKNVDRSALIYNGRFDNMKWWVEEPRAIYSSPPPNSRGEYIGETEGVSIPHPEGEEIIAALEEVVRLLSPWKRKKGKR